MRFARRDKHNVHRGGFNRIVDGGQISHTTIFHSGNPSIKARTNHRRRRRQCGAGRHRNFIPIVSNRRRPYSKIDLDDIRRRVHDVTHDFFFRVIFLYLLVFTGTNVASTRRKGECRRRRRRQEQQNNNNNIVFGAWRTDVNTAGVCVRACAYVGSRRHAARKICAFPYRLADNTRINIATRYQQRSLR